MPRARNDDTSQYFSYTAPRVNGRRGVIERTPKSFLLKNVAVTGYNCVGNSHMGKPIPDQVNFSTRPRGLPWSSASVSSQSEEQAHGNGTGTRASMEITPVQEDMGSNFINTYLPLTWEPTLGCLRTKNGIDALWIARSQDQQKTLIVLENGVSLFEWTNQPANSYPIPYDSESGESSRRLTKEEAAVLGQNRIDTLGTDWGKFELLVGVWASKSSTEATPSAATEPNKPKSVSGFKRMINCFRPSHFAKGSSDGPGADWSPV